MRFNVLLWIFLLCSLAVVAQDINELEAVLLEEIVKDLEEEVDVSEFMERLRYFLKKPINLNQTDEATLSSLLFLSSLQVANIIQHRKIAGPFISVYELQVVPGLDSITIDRLYPFVKVEAASAWPDFSVKQLLKGGDQELIFRYARVLERQEGYYAKEAGKAGYLGDANRYSLWYRLTDGKRLHLAINGEKDAGEPFFKDKQRYGFDHYGLSLSVKKIGPIAELIVGDYGLQVGQGLLFWNGLRLGKGALMGSSVRQGVGLKSYSSMNESNFLRGIALRVPIKKVDFVPFVSYRTLDGHRQQTDSGAVILQLQTSGLHRSPSEQAYRHAIGQWLAGLMLSYEHKRFKSQLTTAYTRFDGKFEPANQLRNRYAFRGQELLNWSVAFQYTYKNMYSYGEFAQQLGAGWATNVGLLASLHPRVNFFSQYRRYQPNYYAFYAQAISESSGVVNEQGFFMGLRYQPSRKLEWVAYVDIFRFPWFRYRVDAPSNGADFLTQLTYTWYKRGAISFRYRYRLREENSRIKAAEHFLESNSRQGMRIDFRYKLTSALDVKSRLEVLRYANTKGSLIGRMTYQELQWKPVNKAFQCNVGITLFHADDYAVRMYSHEKDMLYAYSSTMLNKRGFRYYSYGSYRLSAKTQLWLRYAQTIYKDEESVGSGLERSQGNKRSEVKLQIRHQW